MKKLVLFVGSLVLSSFFRLEAQSNIRYNLGVKAGVNWSRFIEKETNNKFWFSSLVGLSLEQRFTNRVALTYEMLYSRQGNMNYFSNPGYLNSLRSKYDYLILPISLRYRLRNSPFILTPGVQVGYLLDRQVDFLPISGHTNKENPWQRKTDYGAAIGVGLNLGKHVFTEARYYQSVRSTIKRFLGVDPVTGMAVVKPSPGSYNQVISISLTYYPFHRQ